MLPAAVLAAYVTLSKAERDADFDKPPQNTLRDCGDAPPVTGDCRLPPDLTQAAIDSRLAGRDKAWWREGDEFIVVARRDTDQAYLCCAARGAMDRVGGDDWALRLRVADLDRATIDVSVLPGETGVHEVWRGPKAPPALATTNLLRGRLTPILMHSKYLADPRGVLIYTPPGFDPAKKYLVVYMADGNLWEIAPGFIEPLILSGRLPPMILVMIWPGNSHNAREDRRSEEYLLGWPNGEGYFTAYENFLLKEVMPLVEAKYGASTDPARRIVTGFSSGAAWAISMGLRHPDVFRNVIAESLVWNGRSSSFSMTRAGASFDVSSRSGGGGDFVAEIGQAQTTRFFLSAGTLEPEFYKQTRNFADRARAAGHDVKLETTVSGHTLTIWPAMLVDGLKWFLAPVPSSTSAAPQ